MGNWSSPPRLEAFRSRSLIKMSRGGTPPAISSASSAKRLFAASPNDDGLFTKQASVNAEPASSFRFVALTLLQGLGSSSPPTEALNASRILRCAGFDFLLPSFSALHRPGHASQLVR